MKKIFIFSFLCLFSYPLYAQSEETLLSGKIKSGGFGGPVIKITSVNGLPSVFTGARGGWIIKFPSGNSFVLGGGGYGLVTDVRLKNSLSFNGQPLFLNVGYGGLDLEYVHSSPKLIHFSVETLIGAGNVSYALHNLNRNQDFPDQSFFVIEPGMNVMVNVTNFFRFGAGLSYRIVRGAHLNGTSDQQLSDINGILTFKFGKF